MIRKWLDQYTWNYKTKLSFP